MSGFLQAMIGLMTGAPGIVSLPSTIAATSTGVSTSSTVTLNSNGAASATNDALSAWITPTFTEAGSFYQCRASGLSGNTPTGTMDTWLDLTSNRSWNLTEDAGAEACSFTLEIRNKVTQVVLASSAVSIEVFPE